MEQMINKDSHSITKMKLGNFGDGFFRLPKGGGKIFYFYSRSHSVHPVLEDKTISNLLDDSFSLSDDIEILSWESVGVTKIQWADD